MTPATKQKRRKKAAPEPPPGNAFGPEPEEAIEEAEVVSIAATIESDPTVDLQVATAKRFPRAGMAAFRTALAADVTVDSETAGSMFYALPRKDQGKKKVIQGPSARFAEAAAHHWGNLRAQGAVTREDHGYVYASGIAWDLEKNVAIKVDVRRRILNRTGERYTVDMVATTGMAAISIALRNAILKVIPKAAWNDCYESARKLSIGKAGDLTRKRQNAFAWFAKSTITEEQILEHLGVGSVDEVGEEELIELRGLRTALEEGDTTVEQVFGPSPEQAAEATREKAEDLKKRMAGENGKEATAEEPADPELGQLDVRYRELLEATHPEWKEADVAKYERAVGGNKTSDAWTVEDYRNAIAALERGLKAREEMAE